MRFSGFQCANGNCGIAADFCGEKFGIGVAYQQGPEKTPAKIAGYVPHTGQFRHNMGGSFEGSKVKMQVLYGHLFQNYSNNRNVCLKLLFGVLSEAKKHLGRARHFLPRTPPHYFIFSIHF
jgi:hypothetical protein